MSPLPLVISLTYIYIDHLYTHALVQILILRQTKKNIMHQIYIVHSVFMYKLCVTLTFEDIII